MKSTHNILIAWNNIADDEAPGASEVSYRSRGKVGGGVRREGAEEEGNEKTVVLTRMPRVGMGSFAQGVCVCARVFYVCVYAVVCICSITNAIPLAACLSLSFRVSMSLLMSCVCLACLYLCAWICLFSVLCRKQLDYQ
jgi:hypothetical protein